MAAVYRTEKKENKEPRQARCAKVPGKSGLVTKTRYGQWIDWVVQSSDYTGTVVGGGGPSSGIVAVQDAFEVSFIALRSVDQVTESKGATNRIALCRRAAEPAKKGTKAAAGVGPLVFGPWMAASPADPVPAFRSLLRSLWSKDVILQVSATFVEGLVLRVWKHRDAVALLTSRGTVTRRLSDIEAILVPLAVASRLVKTLSASLGDPVYQLTLTNDSKSIDMPAVYQGANPGSVPGV